MQSSAIPQDPANAQRGRGSTLLFTTCLAAVTFLVHGYHPLAEDGGIYVAAVEHSLHPALFPHDASFVTAYQAYSAFTPIVATLTRDSHLPLSCMLLCLHLLCIWLFVFAGLRIARQCFPTELQARFGVALLSAWFTLPVAGTSLYLMEPYLTARSISTPLSLLAISFALAGKAAPLKLLLWSAGLLVLAALVQPLMAIHAFGFIAILLVTRLSEFRARVAAWTGIAVAAIGIACALQETALPESHANALAIFSRYYWFLSQWQWFEWLGILAPLVLLMAIPTLAPSRLTTGGRNLAASATATGFIALCISVLFVREHFATHPIARLQPLRIYLILYAVMAIFIGGILVPRSAASTARAVRFSLWPTLAVAGIAILMCFVQRQTFPASLHLELPGRKTVNPWAQAFLWARDNTPVDALFALDSRYVNLPGEDAQNFRAIAQRSMIPDFSKDGGVAANVASLAETWYRGEQAQHRLNALTDVEWDPILQPFQANWMIVPNQTSTHHPCPYRNSVVKICHLPSR